jgi:Ran-binding protein 1
MSCHPPQPTPVFGSGLVGTGFAGFTGVSSTSSAAPAAAAADAGEGDDGADPEEECQAEFKPLVQLEEVETSTGEEDEECLIDL